MSEVQQQKSEVKTVAELEKQVGREIQLLLPPANSVSTNLETRFSAFVNSIKDPDLRKHVQGLPDEIKKTLIQEFDRVTRDTFENLSGLTPKRMNAIQGVIAEQYHFSRNAKGSDLIQTRDQDPTTSQGTLNLALRQNNGQTVMSADARYNIPLKNMPQGLENLFIAAAVDYSPGNEDRKFNINQIGAGLRGDQDLGSGQLSTQVGVFLEQTGLLQKDRLSQTTTTNWSQPLIVNLDTGQVLKEGEKGIESITSSQQLSREMKNNPNVIVLSGGVGYTAPLSSFAAFYFGAKADIEIPTSGGNTELDARFRAALKLNPIQAFDPLNPNSDRLELVLGAQQDLTTARLGYENTYDPTKGRGEQSMRSYDGTIRYHWGKPGESLMTEISARKIEGQEGMPIGIGVAYPFSKDVTGYLQYNNQTLFPDRMGGVKPSDSVVLGVQFRF